MNDGHAGPQWLEADWVAPANVRAIVSTRIGGFSRPPWNELNVALHVGDEPASVVRNRQALLAALGLARAPQWLNQVHGTDVVIAGAVGDAVAVADAVISRQPGLAAAVMTADCLPVLICDAAGSEVAVAHAGWRGLLHGVLENTVARMRAPVPEMLAWLGPAIGPQHFEVGDEVRQAFVAHDAAAGACFVASPHAEGKWLADLYALARQRLRRAGIGRVHGGGLCTFSDSDRFYSYRRDGVTGRMVSLIWIRE